MSSDRETRATRRNMVAKHSRTFNKSYAIRPRVAYNRKCKAQQRDLRDTLVPDSG